MSVKEEVRGPRPEVREEFALPLANLTRTSASGSAGGFKRIAVSWKISTIQPPAEPGANYESYEVERCQ
jgi:hypothetical protein